MHGTAKALIVAAVAFQASANPVRLFERQESSSSAPVSSAFSSLSSSLLTSVATVTATATGSSPPPEPTLPTFPFPGSNGTYYICSFPSSNNATNSTESATSTSSFLVETAPVTSAATAAETSLSSTRTSEVATISSPSSYIPIPTPTEFTVIGLSTTAIIECIAVPTGVHPHPPPPANASSTPSVPLPTFTPGAVTSSTLIPSTTSTLI